MSDLADLFPGFASEWINTSRGRIFARVGGKGPPLLLLHGFPQSHVMWHRVAPLLAEKFTLVIPDLPGYGWSDVPESDAAHTNFTKRVMAQAMIDVLDILPTYEYWARMDRAYALKIYHWAFLAQPAPLPETLIAGNSDFYLKTTMGSWSKDGDVRAFDPKALNHYLMAMRDPLRIHAMCEDYRAGAYADFEHDKADRDAGNRITAPLLALWGGAGIAAAAATPLDTWKTWAANVRGQAIASGHFLPEENPQATAHALLAFFLETS
jgi:haloacetate dehalogenase